VVPGEDPQKGSDMLFYCQTRTYVAITDQRTPGRRTYS